MCSHQDHGQSNPENECINCMPVPVGLVRVALKPTPFKTNPHGVLSLEPLAAMQSIHALH